MGGPKTAILLCSLSFVVFSCGNEKNRENDYSDSVKTVSNNPAEDQAQTPAFTGNMEVKTFEVKDSASQRSIGWGYDIYIDGKRGIHQPIIPAIPGNNPFKTEEKAMITGTFAMNKMKKTGSLPTLSVAELDSLGVTK
jgi:hypothetical protein